MLTDNSIHLFLYKRPNVIKHSLVSLRHFTTNCYKKIKIISKNQLKFMINQQIIIHSFPYNIFNFLSQNHFQLFLQLFNIFIDNMKILLFFLISLWLNFVPTIQTELDDAVNCVKEYIQTYRGLMKPQYFEIFQNSFHNTLSTTVSNYNLTYGNEQTYIITGDIEAMWLRDSTNQFLPYLRMKKQCPNMRNLTKGLINTQAKLIMTDGYTNAFKKFQKAGNRPFYLNDKTQTLIFGVPIDLCLRKQYATKSIWERKFEIDSLASFLRLCYQYTKRYNQIDFVNFNVIRAIKRILTVIDQQTKDQDYEKKNQNYYYTFFRSPTQLENGHIKPSKYTGLVKTGFRPSDDPNELPFNIPGNAMLATYLQKVVNTVLSKISSQSIFKSISIQFSEKMLFYSKQIKAAIYNYGVVNNQGKMIFAYQIDGFGKYRTYDDANLPSLLSLPYMQFLNKDQDNVYKATRQFLLSKKNKYFYSNDIDVYGIGSSHTSAYYIWPLALITQILTTDNINEIKSCLNMLKLSAVNNCMHESFSVRNPTQITRNWFAWANSYFGEMIIELAQKKPETLR